MIGMRICDYLTSILNLVKLTNRKEKRIFCEKPFHFNLVSKKPELLSSVVFYYKDSMQHGIHLFYTIKKQNVVKFDIIYGSRTNLNACKIQLIILFHTVNVKLKGNRRIYRTFA